MVDGGPKKNSKKREESSRLRRDIERTIWSSLDPISAQKAIDSLNPLLKNLGDSREKHEQRKISDNRNNNQHKPLQKEDSHIRQKVNHPIILPSIQSMLTDFRRQSLMQKSSASSLRCISEPVIPVRDMFPSQSHSPFPLEDKESYSLRKEKQQLQEEQQLLSSRSVNDQRSRYNADAAVSLLRLERVSRKPPDFSAFWDWKVSNATDKNCSETKRDVSKAQIEREIAIYMGYSQKGDGEKNIKETKIQRVKRMQLAYSSHSNGDDDDKDLIDQLQQERKFQRSSLSNQKETQNISEKKNNNKANINHRVNSVTDSDLVAISKYFEYFEDISNPGTPVKKRIKDKLKLPRNQNPHVGSSPLPYILDPTIVHQDIPQDNHGDDDKDFNFPYPYYSFSPTNSKPSTPYLLNSKRNINSRQGLLSQIGDDDSYPKKRNQLPKMNQTPHNEDYDGNRNVDTPDINNFYVGGIDGLLDWTRTLDADLI